MYIKAEREVGGVPEVVEYTVITALSFAPAADLVGASIPINEFQVDIHTQDYVPIGRYAELYDDNDTLWAKYWIVYAEHIDANTLRIRAQSTITLMDRVKLPAQYFNGDSLQSVLDWTIVSNSGAVGLVVMLPYTLDSAFDSATITGFCPEQTARERLTWICFTIGAYVKTHFNDEIEILPIDDTETLIPKKDTYWKPTLTIKDHVTAVRAKYYSFTEGTPGTTDTYVEDHNGTVYIVRDSEITVTNPLAPSSAPENIIAIEGVYLINQDNVSDVLNYISAWYFKRTEIDAEVIDNAEYVPGDRVILTVDDASLYNGYINSAEFAFGLQSKAKLHLTASESVEAASLTIYHMYGEIQLDKRVFLLPIGYGYEIRNPYIDMTMNGERFVFRPLTETITGTIAAGENVVTVQYEIALDWKDGDLEIISVDDIYIDGGSTGGAGIGIDGTEIIDPPASIQVITPPTKTTYEDGETIDYTGMVVKAYKENGDLWTNSTHPDGVIPIAELTLDYTAEYSEQSHSEAEATVEQDNPNIMQCIKDVGVFKFGYANDATIYWHREFEAASFHHEFNDKYDFTTANSPVYIVMLHIISAGEPTNKYYIALYSPEPFSVMVHHVREAISSHDSDIDETVEWTSNSRTFSGKTFSVIGGSQVTAEDIIEIMPSANAIDSSFDSASNRFSQLGYTILFSDISVAMPVKYDTGSGNILETSVNITVAEVTT